MQEVVIQHNLDKILKKLDYKLAKKIDVKIIRTVTNKVKTDVKRDVKKIYKKKDKILENIYSSINKKGEGRVIAKYIAYFLTHGVKERKPKKKEYMYFINNEGKLIRKKIVSGIVGSKFMDNAQKYVDGGKYNDLIDKTIQKILEKEFDIKNEL